MIHPVAIPRTSWEPAFPPRQETEANAHRCRQGSARWQTSSHPPPRRSVPGIVYIGSCCPALVIRSHSIDFEPEASEQLLCSLTVTAAANRIVAWACENW